MTQKLVVVGGIAAGLSAASKAKRLLPGLRVTVYEKSGYVSTGACGLPYFVGGSVREARDLLSLSKEDLQGRRGITVKTAHEVLSIDPASKTVEALDLENGARISDSYDDLVIATGASPIRPPLPNVGAQGVFYLRTLEDGIALRAAAQSGVKRAVIVGGGLIGLESAEQLAQTGISVTVVEAMSSLLPILNDEDAESVRQELIKHGVEVELNARAEEVLTQDGKAAGLRLSNGKELRAEIILMSIGVKPNTELASRCGVELGERGAIVTDNRMRTNVPSVWACGDCAESHHRITGMPCWIPSGTTANKQGRVAGSNIGGEAVTFPGVLGSQVTKVFDLYAAATGLSLKKALEAGFDARSTSIIKSDKASYYPGGVDSRVTLVYERCGGRILGAQAIGGISVAGRVNLLVAAITAGMTVSQLNDLDLLYSPAVAPVYDPLLIAAAQAIKQVVAE